MSIELIEIIDWFLDGTALILSLLVAKYVLDLSKREVVILVLCTVIYTMHEIWESGMFGYGSHRSFELWIQDIILIIS
jgi:hypothetical protein